MIRSCTKNKKCFHFRLSLYVFLIVIFGAVVFNFTSERYIYKALLNQALEDNLYIGNSILGFIEHSREESSDSTAIINLLQHICSDVQFPDNGYICAIDSGGKLLATSTQRPNRHLVFDKELLMGADKKKVSFSNFFLTNPFEGYYNELNNGYPYILAAIKLKGMNVKMLILEDSKALHLKAVKKSRFIFLFGVLFALMSGIFVFLTSKLQIRKYQEIITQNNEDLLESNNKLQEVNREKESLVGMMAHDLKSPLNNIMGLSEMITQTGELNEQQTELIQHCRNEITSGLNLINDTLSISQLEQQVDQQLLFPIDIHKFMNNIMAGHIKYATSKHINMAISLPEQTVMLQSEESNLKRILDNLVSNAIKFTTHGKRVKVDVRTTESHIYFRIEDEGQGIKKEEFPRLFKKFEKLQSQPTGGESSTGLGLYIVKLLTNRLNGEITCESEWNKGSVFTLKLALLHS